MRRIRIEKLGLLMVMIAWISAMTCQAQREIEQLDRGLLAVKVSNGVYLSWRVLGDEYLNVGYNLYRESSKLNAEPISGASCFLDTGGTMDIGYSVAAVINGIEQEKSVPVTAWGSNSRLIPLQRPGGGTTPDGVNYTYNASDLSVGDLDGDGQYEIILKWDPSNSKDNSRSGYTGNVYLDAYEIDGTFLWRIDLGINIRAGAHYTQFMVYDLDGDGKSEVACKTADGSIDGAGTVIGNATADYRNSSGYILAGPEFLTVFNGETGAAMATTNYIPARGSVSSWGDNYGNRVDRFLAGIAYLDGKRPSLLMCRGYYTRSVLAAWDWRDGVLSSRWVFDTNNGYPSYEGQGNHNLSVADVDEDGKDEIIYGAMAVDDDGSPLWNTGLHHGDAMHVSDIDPARPGLEKWGIHEGSGTASALLDARTGEIIWHSAPSDAGRGVSADLVASHPGMECWGGTVGLRSARGDYVGTGPSSSNFLVWWDGDDLRELLDKTTVSKYGAGNLLTAVNCSSNNGTKANPGLSADLLGDWREEIIFRTVDNNSLRLYVSTTLTSRRLFTLMHDPQYRVSIAWQNVAYNQPPHTSFFLGHDMTPPPPPPTIRAKLDWSSGNSWDLTSDNWDEDGQLVAFQNGNDVLFDLSGNNSSAISIIGNMSPSEVSVYAPGDYSFDGPGSLTGTMNLLKAGAGSLTLNSDHDFSGLSSVWQGSLIVNGILQESYTEVYKGATAGGSGTFGKGLTLHKQGILVVGPRGGADTLHIKDHLRLDGEAVLCFDLSDDSSGIASSNDVLMIQGDLVLEGSNTFEIQLLDESLQAGQYTLIRYTGTFTGDMNAVSCKGMAGIPYKLIDTGNSIILEIIKLRSPKQITWQGGTPNDWDIANHLNWLNAGNSDWFIPFDTVIFNDDGVPNTSVRLTETLQVGQVVVDASEDFIFEGPGMVSGPGSLLKSGEGTLQITGEHDYTGLTMISSGILRVLGLKNGDKASAIGASTEDPSNLVINGGNLTLTGASSFSNRGITIGEAGGSLRLAASNTDLTLSGNITGTGLFSKSGLGTLTLSATNTWTGGMYIIDGTVSLGSEEANLGGLGTGKVILQNAVLRMLDDRNSYTDGCNWDLVVPEGSISWLHLDSRGSLLGSLEGSGILNIITPFIRSELSGDWSAFTGRINVSTLSDDASFLPGTTSGYENAAINLSDNVLMLYMNSQDVSISIGELTGTTGSELGSGGQGSNTITWVVGGRDTNAEFHGLISDRQFKNSGSVASIIKTGSGHWTLSHANTYSGPTDIQGGILTITNTSGSATGSGDVYVRMGGALRGNGSLAGKLIVENQASVSIGTGTDIDILSINNGVEFQAGSYLSIKINPAEKTADKLVIGGHLKLGGILYINKSVLGGFTPGDTYRILDAASASGEFDMILPLTPGDGLRWDTTWLSSDGLLHITTEGSTGIEEQGKYLNLSIFPNPGSSTIKLTGFTDLASGTAVKLQCYDQQGRMVHLENFTAGILPEGLSLDVQNWAPGIYLFEIIYNNKTCTRRFIKE